MSAEDFEFEELVIAVAVGSTLHELDLVVGPFQGACRDWVIVVVQEPEHAHGKNVIDFASRRGHRLLADLTGEGIAFHGLPANVGPTGSLSFLSPPGIIIEHDFSFDLSQSRVRVGFDKTLRVDLILEALMK
jgi:hypothetical protein